MGGFVLRRLLWLAPVLFFISIVTFALMHAVQGGPWDGDWPLPESSKIALDHKYGLDQPVWRQYLTYAWDALHGDLGISFQNRNQPAARIIVAGFRVSAVLGSMALVLAACVGVGFGVLSATNRNRLPDYAGVAFASLGSCVPGFVLGVFLIYVFGVRLHWLPTFGWDLKHGPIPGWLPPWRQMVLPVLTLAALPSAYLARVTRASLLDVLRQDYVRTARAKGLGSLTIVYRHSLRNAAIPVLTVIGPITATLITGSFIIEQLYSIPGSGRLLVQAVSNRDYGLIMGATLFYAFVVALANLAIDIAYAFVDPRIRYR